MEIKSHKRDLKATHLVLNILNFSMNEYKEFMFELGIEKVEKHHKDKIDINKTKEYWDWVELNFVCFEKTILSLFQEYRERKDSKKLMNLLYKKVRSEIKNILLSITISKGRWAFIDAEYNQKFKETPTIKKQNQRNKLKILHKTTEK